MSPFNEAQQRRDRYNDEFGTSRGSAGAAAYDEFMPEGSHPSSRGRGRTPEMFSRARDSVQRGISGASDYVKSHDMDEVIEDARNVARRNPKVAIAAFVAVGFLIGRLMRRSR